MIPIVWNDPNERYYEHGLDRGVLYIPDKDPIPWNGLQSFDEGGSGSSTVYYRDGVVYLADADASDFSGKLSAIFYPREFSECLGFPEVADGLFVDNQKPKRFHLSYRTLVGSGTEGDLFGYQIHLLYYCMASIAPRSRKTIGDGTDIVTFDFDIVCTPVKMPGYRPTAHYVIDTRGMSPDVLVEIEGILYGTGDDPGHIIDPTELYELMNFGDAIKVTSYANGNFKVEASSSNIVMLDGSHFQLNNINSTAPDVNGQYVISTGGTTTVVTG